MLDGLSNLIEPTHRRAPGVSEGYVFSLWDHSFFTGSGFPLTNSPAASCHCSISWSTSSTADICRDHLNGLHIFLCLATLRSSYAIHPSAWNRYSANFAFTEFSEVGSDYLSGEVPVKEPMCP